ncbi:hypothetical protein DMENIID0001_075760 [Sergentomyia squamirostris]
MLIKNHNQLKKIIDLFFTYLRLDFLPDTKFKLFNALKLTILPMLYLFSCMCSSIHLFVQVEHYDDLIDVSFSLIFALAFFQCFMTMLTFLIANKNRILKVVEYFYKVINSDDLLISNLRQKHYLRNTKLALWLARVFMIGITLVGVSVVSFDIYRAKTHFPLFFYIPWISGSSIFYYPVNYIFQTSMYFITLELTFGSDVIIMIMIMYCDAELRSLRELIADLNDSNIIRARASITMRTIHNVQLMIYEKANELSNCFWHYYFYKLLTITLYLCSLLFIFTKLDVSLIVPCLCFIAMTSQVFVLCFFGQIIQSSSERMSECLYMTKWYEMNVKDQRDFQMLMMTMQQPVTLETFGFGTISIYTFVQIFKAALSYATILYAVFK